MEFGDWTDEEMMQLYEEWLEGQQTGDVAGT